MDMLDLAAGFATASTDVLTSGSATCGLDAFSQTVSVDSLALSFLLLPNNPKNLEGAGSLLAGGLSFAVVSTFVSSIAVVLLGRLNILENVKAFSADDGVSSKRVADKLDPVGSVLFTVPADISFEDV